MKNKSRIYSIILTIVFFITSTFAVFADVDDEQDKLDDLNQQKQEAESQIQGLQDSKKDAEDYIASVDSQLTSLAVQLHDTNQKLEKTETKIKKTKKKLKKAQESVEQQYEDMKLRIQYMYENGDTQMIDLLFGSKSVTEFLNKAEYITELADYDQKMLDKLKETKQEVADAKVALEEEKDNLVAIQEQQESDQTKLEKLSEAKKQELSSYETLLAQSEDSAQSLEDEISQQEQRVAAAEQESIEAARRQAQERNQQQANNVINDTPTPRPHVTASGFTWPLPGYTSVSSDFGYRSDPFGGGGTVYHSGIDIPAPAGTPIVAASSGRVEWANYSSSAGNWIGISHGNGLYTVYMHMSALLVSAGTEVSAGQTIGLVGTTGSSTGNHLHFSVRLNGAYVSPWSYVSN